MSDFTVINWLRLRELFKSKEWDKNDNESEIFKRYSYLLNNLTEVEQDLILDLSERYLWVNYSKYLGLLEELFRLLSAVENLASCKRVYFFPVIKPEDEDETKSGNVLLYMVKTVKSFLPSPLDKIEFKIIEQFDKITDSAFRLEENELLVLIDDFIGSGTTISSTFFEIDKNESIPAAQIKVMAITIMREAVNLLDEKNIAHYQKYIETKGISDYYGDEVEKKMAIIKKIETMTKAGGKFKLGYKKSEALVTMARTPNNTFSIFWSNHIKNDKEYTAPFLR